MSFSGQVLANEGDYGVTVPDETALLARHGHHVLVSAQDRQACSSRLPCGGEALRDPRESAACARAGAFLSSRMTIWRPSGQSSCSPPLKPDAISLRVDPGNRVSLLDRPGGKVIKRIGDTTEFGSPQVLSPTGQPAATAGLRSHTSLGNDRVAWLQPDRAPVSLRTRVVRFEVDLSGREVVVHPKDGPAAPYLRRRGRPRYADSARRVLRHGQAARRRLRPVLRVLHPRPSGHQPDLPQGWSGGDRLAIHGSPTPTWGQNVSNGCLHAGRQTCATC